MAGAQEKDGFDGARGAQRVPCGSLHSSQRQLGCVFSKNIINGENLNGVADCSGSRVTIYMFYLLRLKRSVSQTGLHGASAAVPVRRGRCDVVRITFI